MGMKSPGLPGKLDPAADIVQGALPQVERVMRDPGIAEPVQKALSERSLSPLKNLPGAAEKHMPALKSLGQKAGKIFSMFK
jgi:hypothetical protein